MKRQGSGNRDQIRWLRFVLSHLCPTERVKDGAPFFHALWSALEAGPSTRYARSG